MFIEVECHHCHRTFTVEMHGKTALEDMEKYDTKIHGKPYTMVCFCGYNLHIIGSTLEDPILKKKTPSTNKVAEI